ncbi:MAG: signal recognition particle-docking protein FtsY [Actinomycetota bacterium]|nr:signal recognition particle-docking protein FtsY [Actinomycetota bacterium]
MVALWIALGVAAIVVLVAGSLGYATTARRRRGRGASARPPARPPAPRPSPARPPTAAPTETQGAATLAEGPLAEGPVEAPVEVRAGAPAAEVAPPTFLERLGRTRGVFAGLRSMRGRGVDPATWDELEESLLRADVGVATTDALLGDLRRRVKEKEIGSGAQLVDALRADLVHVLSLDERWDAAADGARPPGPDGQRAAELGSAVPAGRELRFDDEEGVVNVWLFVGVNGVGKTTTVGKVARQQVALGRTVLLAAGDTFRAAAGEQLGMWAQRVGTEIVRGAEGGDPSAVVFDAVQRAAARGNSLVLADTAGRLHTKVNLVEELKKIRRVADRPPGRVTEVLLVLDATTGQNGLVQARQFTEAVAVTGVVLTKLDGTAKGGIVVAIQRELRLPVKLVGLGEGPDDLVAFDPADFVGALLG